MAFTPRPRQGGQVGASWVAPLLLAAMGNLTNLSLPEEPHGPPAPQVEETEPYIELDSVAASWASLFALLMIVAVGLFAVSRR